MERQDGPGGGGPCPAPLPCLSPLPLSSGSLSLSCDLRGLPPAPCSWLCLLGPQLHPVPCADWMDGDGGDRPDQLAAVCPQPPTRRRWVCGRSPMASRIGTFQWGTHSVGHCPSPWWSQRRGEHLCLMFALCPLPLLLPAAPGAPRRGLWAVGTTLDPPAKSSALLHSSFPSGTWGPVLAACRPGPSCEISPESACIYQSRSPGATVGVL